MCVCVCHCDRGAGWVLHTDDWICLQPPLASKSINCGSGGAQGEAITGRTLSAVGYHERFVQPLGGAGGDAGNRRRKRRLSAAPDQSQHSSGAGRDHCCVARLDDSRGGSSWWVWGGLSFFCNKVEIMALSGVYVCDY